jgi:PUA domain protein
MFKKFNPQEDIVSQVPIKSSVQRAIRTQVLEQFSSIEPFIDNVLPKKEKWILIKCHGHLNLISINYGPPVLFNLRTGPYFPSLRLLHAYPFLLPRLQVDKGAIKHILKGADIMCPGLTSAGARIDEALPSNRMVGIFAEGKEHALAIGITKLSTEEIRNVNKGVAVENIHYLNDGLWKLEGTTSLSSC